MLVGGSEAKVNPLSLSRFNLFAQFSKRNDDPEGAIRPFDRDRDGTAPGEGAAVFTLEELEHAKARGAKIYGEVVAVASGVDRGQTGPGLAQVIRNALEAAGITAADVDHVNAHGLGTTKGDAFEARGIGEVFGKIGAGVRARCRGSATSAPASALDGAGVQRAGPPARAAARHAEPREPGPGVPRRGPHRRPAADRQAVRREDVVHRPGPVRARSW